MICLTGRPCGPCYNDRAALRPGETRTFTWQVTAVKSGVHSIKYKIAAGLNGKAKAVVPGTGAVIARSMRTPVRKS